MKNTFLKSIKNRPQGLLMAMALFLVSVVAVVVSLALAMSGKVDRFNFYGQAAKEAVTACVSNLENILAATPTVPFGSCNNGEYIDWTAYACTTDAGTDTGPTDTLLTVGDCSCAVIFGSDNAGAFEYNITATAFCPKESRQKTNVQSVYAVKDAAVSYCQTCTGMCPTPLPDGATCKTNCGTSCPTQCCATSPCGAVSGTCGGL